MINIWFIVVILVLIIIPITLAIVGYQKIPEHKDRRIKDKELYKWIVSIAIIYYLGGILILIISGNLEKIINKIADFAISDKYMWCGAWSLIGFSIAISQRRFESRDKRISFLPYLAFYPFVLLLITSIVYSLTMGQNDNVFYPLTLGLCGTLSFLADYYWILMKKIVEKAIKNI